MLRALVAGSALRCGLGGWARDEPIVGHEVRYLDGHQWTASARVQQCSAGSCTERDITIPAQVPGDLISDLHAAGLIGNPFHEVNWLNSSLWDGYSWTYSVAMESPPPGAVLVFDGVKMGARARLNGVELGEFTDQFLRYSFPIGGLARAGQNLLEVQFDKNISCDGRWMACTGGWDWAPYSNTRQEGGTRTFSKGIWKHVYLVDVRSAAIEHLVPHVFFLGEYPTAPLQDGQHGGFEVRARLHFSAPAAVSGELMVEGEWGRNATVRVSLTPGRSNVTVAVAAPASMVRLWWPAGLGAQPLYRLQATFRPDGGDVVSAARSIGFRFVALATGNDTDAEWVRRAGAEEGSESHGMMFRVNGAATFARGANMIPMEELEGWLSDDAHRALVRHAAAANMNMLRVWGGGMFLIDAFYDECDRLGVMLFHDMQYAQQGHSPRRTATQEGELRHAVRRLSHHASIVMWDGCNECAVRMDGPTSIYATFVMTVVAEEDASRPVWPSCPAHGWATGTHRLSQLPNGNALTTPSQTPRDIEVHGPYYQGSGFPSVNGADEVAPIGVDIPTKFEITATGAALLSTFTSEFGASVMSSFEAMSPTLDPRHWALHGGQPSDVCDSEPGTNDRDCKGDNVMAQRNYPCDGFILPFFGREDLNVTGEGSFKKQLFQCMIGQALVIKQTIELLRSSNSFGVLVWQFNEIWPTGGWGSIEYGNPRFPGQVVGGRWKPLQYWYRAWLFADVMASCGEGGLCYVKSDAAHPFSGQLLVQATAFDDGAVAELMREDVLLPAGAGAIAWFRSDAIGAVDGTTHIVEAVVLDERGVVMSRNLIPFATMEKMKLKKAGAEVTAAKSEDGTCFVVDVRVAATSVFLTLTTLAHGVFEDNAFLLRPPGRRLRFFRSELSPQSFAEDWAAFASSLRVEDVSSYREDVQASALAQNQGGEFVVAV